MFSFVKKWIKGEPIAFVVYSIALLAVGVIIGAIAL